MNQRLSAQRLPEEDEEERRVARGGDEYQPNARRIGPAAAAKREGNERKHLKRVKADEVWNTNITMLQAPARSGNTWPAAGWR